MTEKDLREAITIKLEENGLQKKYDFTELLVNDLLDLIKQQNKELIGEDEPVRLAIRYREIKGRNQFRAELRIRAGLQERKGNDK